MDKIFEILASRYEILQERWHTKTGLLVAVLFFLTVCFVKFDVHQAGYKEVIIISLGSLLIIAVWLITNIRKVQSGKLGIGLAIAHDNSPEAQELLSDFKIALRDALNSSPLADKIAFQDIPQRISKEINDTDKATYWAKKINLTLLIHGNIRLRDFSDGKKHVLDFRGLVRHVEINEDIKNKFSEDFTVALPKRFLFNTNQHLPGCEFVASHVDIATKYIVGIALGFSHNFEASEILLKEAEEKLIPLLEDIDSPFHSTHLRMLEGVKERLKNLYFSWMSYETHIYILKREGSALELTEKLSDKLLVYDPSNHNALLNKAIAVFVFDRDVDKSQEILNQCINQKEAAFLYSQAFLIAYTSQLDDAYKVYCKAFRTPLVDMTIPIQSEEFIHIVLDEEPDKPWLYFALGLINHRAKKDFEAAKRDFQLFREHADQDKFAKQLNIVNGWVNDIDNIREAA